MNFSRRQFVKGGVTAFTFGFAAPQALCDIAFAQGVPSRNLVVVYLSGGNDSLSTVIPYRDADYATRRPTLAVPAGSVLQIGTDSSDIELGLHPRLTGLKSIFDARPPRDRAAHRLRQPEPLALHRLRYLGHGEHSEHLRHRMARPLSRHAVEPRSPRGVEYATRDATPADGGSGRRAGDHQPGHLCLLEPEHAAPKPASSGPRRRESRRTCRWIARTWRS